MSNLQLLKAESSNVQEEKTPIKSTLINYPGMAKIIAEFLKELPAEIENLRAYLSKGDLTSLRRLVHQLRGTCGGYGFGAVTAVAAAAEDAIDSGQDGESIAARVESLIQIIRRIEGCDQLEKHVA